MPGKHDKVALIIADLKKKRGGHGAEEHDGEGDHPSHEDVHSYMEDLLNAIEHKDTHAMAEAFCQALDVYEAPEGEHSDGDDGHGY